MKKTNTEFLKDMNDKVIAYKWIINKLNKFPDFCSLSDDNNYDLDRRRAAQDELIEMKGHDTLNEWCNKWLTVNEIKSLKNAMRQAKLRKKRASKGTGYIKRVDLNDNAHWILSQIAERDGVTLSEVIEKYLTGEYRNNEVESVTG